MNPVFTPRDLRALAPGAALFALYVVAAAAERAALAHGARFPVALLAFGLAVGATWRRGRVRLVPLFAIVSAAIAGVAGEPLGAALAHGLATALALWAAGEVLRRVGFDGNFERPSAVATFLGGAVLAAVPVAACSGLATFVARDLAHAPTIDGASLALAFGRVWMGAVISIALVLPLVATASPDAFRVRAGGHVEVACWTTIMTVVTALVFALPAHFIGVPLFAALLVGVAWAAVRFGLTYALLAAVAGTLAVALSGAFGVGILGDNPAIRAMRLGWNAAMVFGLCALGLNAFVVSRERAERRYRTLFDGSPEPVWLTDPATDRFLEVNAAAVETYGWSAAEFADLRVADVVVRPAHANLEVGENSQELHRCKDGRLLRVYARTRELRLDDRLAQLWFCVDVTERSTLRAALHRASSEERLRVSRELHDGLGQELTGISFVLGGVAAQMRRGDPPDTAEIDRVAELVRSALRSCRMIARGLAPLPDDMPLADALRMLVERLSGGDGATVELDVKLAARAFVLPVHVKDGMFRICQEAVANALRHSGGSVVSIALDATEFGISLTVWDDGRGFDRQRARSGMGLRTLRLRAEEIGAVLSIDSRPGAGSCIECRYLRHAREA
jgi:PAS domain S-box-containing protein